MGERQRRSIAGTTTATSMVTPRRSEWGSDRFNIVDALAKFEKFGPTKRPRHEVRQDRIDASGKRRPAKATPELRREPEIDDLTMSLRLREVLTALNAPIKHVATIAGINHSTLSRITNGKHFPTRKNAVRIAEVLNQLLAERGSTRQLHHGELWPLSELQERG